MYRNNYNNERDNTGGYSRRNNRGYREDTRGGYNNCGNFMNHPYELNQPVRHIATGTRLIVINYGREQIECRKPDLTAEYFYEYELEPIDEDK